MMPLTTRISTLCTIGTDSHTLRNETINEFAHARIAKRHQSSVLETEDGIVLFIYGSPNISQIHLWIFRKPTNRWQTGVGARGVVWWIFIALASARRAAWPYRQLMTWRSRIKS